MREKALTTLLCVMGVLAVSYGMVKDNDVVFVIGLVFIIGGYLLIRRKLKQSVQKRS